ncbi:MAG: hypothetical protein GC193_06375 [Cryomorphaceae bacterium]|nr:hypothetical protein [Cryomorphaceae bacterium]
MTRKHNILTILAIAATSLPMASTPLYDVFNHTSISFSNYVVERKADNNFVRVPIDLVYLHITSPENDRVKAFNDKMLPLLHSYLDREGEFIKVLNDLRRKTDTYNRIIGSNASEFDRDGEIAPGALPTLQGIDSKAISYVADRVFFEVTFDFEIPSGQGYSSRDDREFTVRHLYVGNLQTGKITRLNDVLSSAEYESLELRLSKRINEMYALATSKLNPYELKLIDDLYDEEEEGEEQQQVAACEDICPRVLMQEAEIYWSSWGVLVNFPEFSQTSEIFGGRGFSIFVDYKEAREILGQKEAFSFLNQLNVGATTRRNFNYWDVIETIGNMRKIPTAKDVAEMNGATPKPRSMSLKSYQLFKDYARNYRNNTVFTFNPYGDVVEEKMFNEHGGLYYVKNFTYDAFGNKTSETHKAEHGREDKKSEMYLYDDRGNLLKRTMIDEEDIRSFNYFYNGDYVYMMEHNLLDTDHSEQFNQIKLGSGEMCINDNCYILNAAGKVMGIRARKYIYQQGQIGYDSKGRVVETHLENDRYNYYFVYDDTDRLVQYLGFENQSPTLEVTYAYNGNGKLPISQLKISRNGETVELEEYEWE